MMMNFRLDLPNINIIERDYEDKAKRVLWKSMNKMEELAKRFAPVAFGTLKNSINLSPAFPGERTYTLTDGVLYGIHMEFGTKPHYVPIEPLKLWSKRILGDEKAAYAIRAHIAKFGVNAHPFFRPANDEVRFYWIGKFTNDVFA